MCRNGFRDGGHGLGRDAWQCYKNCGNLWIRLCLSIFYLILLSLLIPGSFFETIKKLTEIDMHNTISSDYSINQNFNIRKGNFVSMIWIKTHCDKLFF